MSKEYNILCTICARAGSKGIKDKNIRMLNGRPLIAYTIEHALNWNKAKRVIVSTDSQKIARIARHFGAEAPFLRPKELSTDYASKISTIRHALLKSEKIFKEKYEIVVDLDITAPVRKTRDLDNCLKIFLREKSKTLFSVVIAHKNPYFNLVERKKSGFVKLCKEMSNKIIRRQDVPIVYSMNASIYFFTRKFIIDKKNNSPISNRTSIYLMDELSEYDIDNEVDFKFIEFLIREGLWKSE